MLCILEQCGSRSTCEKLAILSPNWRVCQLTLHWVYIYWKPRRAWLQNRVESDVAWQEQNKLIFE